MTICSLVGTAQKALASIFLAPSVTSDLDSYIISKNPQSVQEVEYWTKQYEFRQQGTVWYC